MQARIAALITTIFISTIVCAGAGQGSDHVFTNITAAVIQPWCPVIISRIGPGREATTLSIFVKNLTDSSIDAVQIGWFAVWSDHEVSTSLAPASRIKLYASHSASHRVNLARKLPTSAFEIVPFVASVHFSNGTVWSADIALLKRTVIETFAYKVRPA
jgi:hypothetical protein